MYMTDKITRIDEVDNYYFKRDDLFEFGGQRGGKVRTCLSIINKNKGVKKLTTAGSRKSPQCLIVSSIAKELGLECNLHIPTGKLGDTLERAREKGGNIIQHKYGYNSVIIKRCRDDALNNGYLEIPFGMECQEAVEQTRKQIVNIPFEKIKRIVISVGSGMSLCGLLWGLKDMGVKIDVLGIQVGADPKKRLNKYAPNDWPNNVKILKSKYDYHKPCKTTEFKGIKFDEIYESKVIEYLEEGDLFWVIGNRNS